MSDCSCTCNALLIGSCYTGQTECEMSWPRFCRVPELGIYYSTKGEQADAKRTTNLYEGIQAVAVRLAQTSGKSITQVARDLGRADSTLHHWCKLEASQGEQAFVGSGHQTPLEEEVRRLKRELDVVRQERDLLKKVVGIFSREPR